MIVVLTLEVKTLVGKVVTNDCSAGVCETVVDVVVVCNGNVLVLLGVTVSIVILKVSEPIVLKVLQIADLELQMMLLLLLLKVLLLLLLLLSFSQTVELF